MALHTVVLAALVALVHCGSITYTGDVISSVGPLPTPKFSAPLGRPVYTHTPQILEHRKTQKTVSTKYNVPVLTPVKRKKVVQDVTHQYIAKPYAVPKPFPVPHPVPVPYSVPVYHHEVEYKDPVHVVTHHKHTQKVHHFPLVKTADVVHHAQPLVYAAQPAVAHHAAVVPQAAVVQQPTAVFHGVPAVQPYTALKPATVIPPAAPAATVPESRR